jgi:calcineurin-like phosphoesterase family protein
MNKIWLCSDWHFNHNKDFIYGNRGFTSIEEMNQTIIENHNKLVAKNDIVYVLGDCMLGPDNNAGINLIKLMNGIKYLAYGNHDTDTRLEIYKNNNLFKDIQIGYRLKYKKYSLLLSHYPTVTANGSDLRIINLYGHTHQKDVFFEHKPYMYNVGVDAHGCNPVLLDDAIEEIKKYKEFIYVAK